MKTKLQGIGILGSGAWGTALACNLNRKENITLWSYEKQTVKQINKYRINMLLTPRIANLFIISIALSNHCSLLKLVISKIYIYIC